MRRRHALSLATGALAGAVITPAQSATPATAAPTTAATDSAWPTRPVRLIVGFPAGSSPDLTARTLAEPLARALGQAVVVENRVGAGGNIAADLVAKATDDHTFGLMINGNMTIARLLNPAVPYDPLKDLAPISLVGSAPLVLVAAASVPGTTGRELLDALRKAGNTGSYGSPGVGTVAHIGMELLKGKAGLEPVHVPYPGNPQVVNAMIGGQIQLALLPPGIALPQVRAGRLKALGVTSIGRSSVVPELASLDEQGLTRGFQLEVWNAVAAPASLPRPVAARLSQLVSDIARSPEVRAKLFQQGWQVLGTTAEGLANRIQADTALLGGVIRSRAIKAE
jgi:tripartite-type tricarboxylate transporter receptor subunit TctC